MNKQQTKAILQEVGIPVAVFCRKIGISDTAYYRWLHDDLRLSEVKEDAIRNYIAKPKKVIE